MFDIEIISINKPDVKRAAQILGPIFYKALLKKQIKSGVDRREKSTTFENRQKK